MWGGGGGGFTCFKFSLGNFPGEPLALDFNYVNMQEQLSHMRQQLEEVSTQREKAEVQMEEMRSQVCVCMYVSVCMCV